MSAASGFSGKKQNECGRQMLSYFNLMDEEKDVLEPIDNKEAGLADTRVGRDGTPAWFGAGEYAVRMNRLKQSDSRQVVLFEFPANYVIDPTPTVYIDWFMAMKNLSAS